MEKRNKLINLITVIFLILQILIGYGLVINNQGNNIYEVIITTAFFIGYTFFEIKYDLYLSNYIRVLVMLTILLHNFVGNYLNFYTKSFIFDKGLHCFGTYAFTLFTYVIINETIKDYTNKKKSLEFIFIFCIGIALGAFFEFLEFAIDLTLKPSIPAQGTLLDTNLDMIWDTVGSAIAAFHLTLTNFKFIRKKSIFK